MSKINKILLILFIFLLSIGNVFAENDDNTYYINSLEDWKSLAKNCELDSFSNNIYVKLNVDLNFNNDIIVIPYFNGTFDGDNHSLNNIFSESSQINDGLFRITGKKSNIKNLKVFLNANHNNNRFGFIGYNQGKIQNVSIKGSFNVLNEAGMIAGYNSTYGLIENCNSDGSINGKEYIGGIAGKNYGTIKNCWNNAAINTDVRKDDFDISTLTIEDLTNGNKDSIITDFGGICGTSFGTILDCFNTAIVGHEHIGYNAGGIAGSQSGFISDCTNSGKIFGRKEVGGIVGQLEPSMSLIYSEDYFQMMSREIKDLSNESQKLIDNLKESKDVSTGYINRMIDDANEMYDAIEIMIDERGSLDHTAFDNARTVLSSSTRDVLDTAKNLVQYYQNNDDILDNIEKLSNQFEEFGETWIGFTDSITNEKDMYKDVSNQDYQNDKSGKILKCINKNTIKGDINIGGIVGSIAIENDSDPEDDFNIIGSRSFDATYEIKAIVDKCINYNSIYIKRNNAGGICGYESIGAIKNSINYGMLNNIDSDYIGGIVGKASSYLTKNYSKCFISGSNYVGGIAGSSMKGDSNGSLSQILDFKSSGGSIFGNYANIDNEIVEKATDIKNNWYVYDDLAGIDGISYDNKAYRLSYEEICKKDLDEDLLKVNVIFMDDDIEIYKKVLEYDESMDEKDVPNEIIKDNEYRIWDNYDSKLLKNVKKDILFTCSYNDIYPSISSKESPLSYVVAIGEFNSKDALKVNLIDEAPVLTNKYITYEIKPELSKSSILSSYNVFANEYKEYKVYGKKDGSWRQIRYTSDGRYICIDDIDYELISVVSTKDYKLFYIFGFILIVLITGLYIYYRKKKKKTIYR